MSTTDCLHCDDGIITDRHAADPEPTVCPWCKGAGTIADDPWAPTPKRNVSPAQDEAEMLRAMRVNYGRRKPFLGPRAWKNLTPQQQRLAVAGKAY